MDIKAEMGTLELAGQVAVVTGGSRGLGPVMAQTLAQAGAAVAVVARSASQLEETAALINQAGGRAIAVAADVTDQQAIQQMAETVEQQLGPIDVLVNNAGVNDVIGPMWEVDADAWWRVIDINLRGSFLCARAVLPGMIARRGGRIINVSSKASIQPRPYISSYGISKTAQTRFAETLAIETKEYGISVFALGPGVVRTEMTKGLRESPLIQEKFPLAGIFNEDGYDPPEHAAQLVRFLASGRADALSGRFITVWDDVTELVKRADEIEQDDLYTLRLNELST